LTLSYTDQQV